MSNEPGRLISVSGDRYLEQFSETERRGIIPPEGYVGPIHSIASIAARGYWEPMPVEKEDSDV